VQKNKRGICWPCHLKEKGKTYRETHIDKTLRQRNQKKVVEMTDGYMRGRMVRKGLEPNTITPQMIELERLACVASRRLAEFRKWRKGKFPQTKSEPATRCKYCGNQFAPHTPWSNYCDSECYRLHHLKRMREDYKIKRGGNVWVISRKVAGRKTTICLGCGEEFEHYFGQKRIYHSVPCMVKHYRDKRRDNFKQLEEGRTKQ